MKDLLITPRHLTDHASQASAAIAYHLTHHVRAFTLAEQIPGADFAAAMAHPELGGQVTPVPAYMGFGSAMDMISWQRRIGHCESW